MDKAKSIAIILAAGQGTRMRSPRPKVLHELLDKSMLSWVVDATIASGVSEIIVVVGHGREEVERELSERYGGRVHAAVQETQRGTGDAVRAALPLIPTLLEGRAERALIINGDSPLIEESSIRALLESRAELALITSEVDEPRGYGRILRARDGAVIGIREERDCSDEERAIREVNPGVYLAAIPFLERAIASLNTDNEQGEYYLTDIVAMAAEGTSGGAEAVPHPIDRLHGVNDPLELARAEGVLLHERRESLMRSGVKMRLPETIFISAECTIEGGVELGANVEIRGRSVIRSGARVDSGSILRDVEVLEGAQIKPYTVAEESVIGPRAEVGPFSHLRPLSELGEGAKVGNFSETKKTRIGKGSKVNHLSYVGDGEIGEGVNIGAGTIFCNYDGVRKHTTTIDDGAFIGSDSQLIAPVRIGKGAYIASGTTVTRDVPDDALAIARAKQENREGFAARLRRRNEAAKEAAKKKS